MIIKVLFTSQETTYIMQEPNTSMYTFASSEIIKDGDIKVIKVNVKNNPTNMFTEEVPNSKLKHPVNISA